MKSYRSKIDIWLVIILIFTFGYSPYDSLVNQNWQKFRLTVLIFSIFSFIFIFIFLSLKYVIEDEFLIIKMNFFIIKKIKISEIKSVAKSIDFTSSPALSIDRLSIKYGKFDEVLISPKNKEAFANDLSNVNTEIIINI